jgi:drug/metabolite transporter (DMT)-like permease
MNMINERNASVFLLLNAILWGSSYIWSKMLLGYLPYFTILFVFSLGGLLAISIIFFRRIRSINRKTIIIGMSIGCLWIMSNIFCMLALKGTSSSNTAFIVQLSVIITPLLMSICKRKMPGGRAVFSAITALAGLLLLTCDFKNLSFQSGDLFALCNAVFFSLYLVALKIYSGKTDPVQFTFVQHVAGTVVFLCMALFFEIRQITFSSIDITGYMVLLLSIAISVSTILIQSSAIKYVRPEKATVIYTLEPVTAAALAYILSGEKPADINAIAGCILILFAVACSVYKIHGTQKLKKQVEYTYLQPITAIRKKGA